MKPAIFFTTVSLLAVLGLVSPVHAGTPFDRARAEWENGRFDAAYTQFRDIRNSRSAFALTLDTGYYLLTSGCHTSDPAVVQNTQQRIAIVARDEQSKTPGAVMWTQAFERELANCVAGRRPGPPPPDIVLSGGAHVRPSYTGPGLMAIYKSPGGEPLDYGMPGLGTAPQEIGAGLPDEVLKLKRSDRTLAQQTLDRVFPGKTRIGKHVVLIRASDTVSDYDLDGAGQEIDRFTAQLVSSFGLPEPDTYFFVIVYPAANYETPDPDGPLPGFPASDRVLGVSDTRTGTAFVLERG